MANAAEPKAQPGTAAAGMGVAKGGWFTELSTMWPGQGLSLKVDEVLYQDRSKFQARRRCCTLAALLHGVAVAARPESSALLEPGCSA